MVCKMISFFVAVVLHPQLMPQQKASISTDDFHLPGLIVELIRNPQLQTEIELSPKQRNEIGEVLSKPEFAQIRRSIDSAPLAGTGDLFVELDSKTQDLFRGVLATQQIAALKRAYVQSRFASRFKATLESEAVVRYIDVKAIQSRYSDEIDRLLKANERATKNLQDRQVRQFLDAFPLDSRPSLARLVGGNDIANTDDQTAVLFDDLPFPQSIASIEMIPILLDDRELSKVLRLDNQQTLTLRRIRGESESDLEQVMRIGSIRKFESEFNAYNERNAKRSKEYLSSLDNRQKLVIGRFTVQKQLQHDPRLILEIPNLKTYLKLDDQAWMKLNEEVERQSNQSQIELCKLNRSMLDELGKSLGPAVAKRLHFLLDDVW